MNTYRVYVLETTVATQPAVHVAFVRGEKYKDAWETARGVLRRDEKYAKQSLFSDAACATKANFAAACTVAKIDDIKPRNVKLDKTALQAIIADAKSSDAEKLAAMQKLLA